MRHVAIANKLMNLNVVSLILWSKNAKMMSILLLVLKTWQEDLGANMGGQTFCDYSLKIGE